MSVMIFLSQVRVVLLAAAPVDQLFVHSGGEGEQDRQLLDDLGLTGVQCAQAARDPFKIKPHTFRFSWKNVQCSHMYSHT